MSGGGRTEGGSVRCRLEAWARGRWKNQVASCGRAYAPTEVEHCANVVSHGVGLGPAVVGLWGLWDSGEEARLYGLATLLLFAASTAYHAVAWRVAVLSQPPTPEQPVPDQHPSQRSTDVDEHNPKESANKQGQPDAQAEAESSKVAKGSSEASSSGSGGAERRRGGSEEGKRGARGPPWGLAQARLCLHMADRGCIYAFMAASYARLLRLGGLAWAVPLHWAAAAAGTIYQVAFHERFKRLDLCVQLAVSVTPAVGLLCCGEEELMRRWELGWMGAGGAAFLVGLVFFKLDGVVPFAHAVWHLHVLLGVALQFHALSSLFSHRPLPHHQTLADEL